MFCYQCQEAAKGTGCTRVGVCGKTDEVSNLQDVLVYTAKGVSYLANMARNNQIGDVHADRYVFESLFVTITNANFDEARISAKILEGFKVRNALKGKLESAGVIKGQLPDCVTWSASSKEQMLAKSTLIGILQSEPNEDLRSLKELLVYGLKGMAAYAEHAFNLGYVNDSIFEFMHKGLAATLNQNSTADELIALVMECGKYGVDVMALLDKANTESYGNPEITRVNLGVRNNPGILISGHDLKDMEELLKQTEGTGVDSYNFV